MRPFVALAARVCRVLSVASRERAKRSNLVLRHFALCGDRDFVDLPRHLELITTGRKRQRPSVRRSRADRPHTFRRIAELIPWGNVGLVRCNRASGIPVLRLRRERGGLLPLRERRLMLLCRLLQRLLMLHRGHADVMRAIV